MSGVGALGLGSNKSKSGKSVISTSVKQVERVLAETPLAAKRDVIAERKTAGLAVQFDFPAVVDALVPWVELAVAQHASERDHEDTDQQAKFIIEQVRAGSEILKCYRGTAAVKYLQDGATVTHSESVFEDLK